MAKLVLREPETPALVAALTGHLLCASELVRTELRRAVARAAPARLPATDSLLTRLQLVRLDREVLDAAAGVPPVSLRSLDAIHLQSALLLGDELDAFVTYDLRQADAGREIGLVVRSPA